MSSNRNVYFCASPAGKSRRFLLNRPGQRSESAIFPPVQASSPVPFYPSFFLLFSKINVFRLFDSPSSVCWLEIAGLVAFFFFHLSLAPESNHPRSFRFFPFHLPLLLDPHVLMSFVRAHSVSGNRFFFFSPTVTFSPFMRSFAQKMERLTSIYNRFPASTSENTFPLAPLFV